jgi:hypothetical protein
MPSASIASIICNTRSTLGQPWMASSSSAPGADRAASGRPRRARGAQDLEARQDRAIVIRGPAIHPKDGAWREAEHAAALVEALLGNRGSEAEPLLDAPFFMDQLDLRQGRIGAGKARFEPGSWLASRGQAIGVLRNGRCRCLFQGKIAGLSGAFPSAQAATRVRIFVRL